MAEYRCAKELVAAVKWLLHKGVTRSTEIARRLEVSPFTINNIKQMLRKRGDYPQPGSLDRRRGRKPLATKPQLQPSPAQKSQVTKPKPQQKPQPKAAAPSLGEKLKAAQADTKVRRVPNG